MKKLVILYFVFIFIQFPTIAQEDWFEQTPDTTFPLRSVHFADNNTGWAVGLAASYKGSILHTTDGGTNWKVQIGSHGTGGMGGGTLRSVYFTDNNTGWAVGSVMSPFFLFPRIIILKTTDAGENWNPQTSGIQPGALTSVHFTNDTTGWAVGTTGTILKTTNGGSIWAPQISDSIYFFESVYFIDQNNGWIVGHQGGPSIFTRSIILNTTNGGEDWLEQSSSTEYRLNSVYFIDNNTGWAVGGGDAYYYWFNAILNTTDGGTNWNLQSTNDTADILYSVCFIDNNTGWLLERGYNPEYNKWRNYLDISNKRNN